MSKKTKPTSEKPTSEMSPDELIAALDAALGESMAENDKLQFEIDRLKGRLDALMQAFEKGGSLGILQHISCDSSLPTEVRMRAAIAACPYERPKFGSVDGVAVGIIDFRERVKQARLKQLELDRAEWARQEAEQRGQTILGSDGGPEPIDPGNPAA
jgi:hypothetical protein